MTLLLYALLTTSCFYLFSRALVTSWLWSRYPKKLATFFDCSACSGAWYGATVALTIGRYFELPIFGLDPLHWTTPILVGLCSVVWTPIVAGFMQRGIENVGVIEAAADAAADIVVE